ncbi:hydroxyneurosporene methyltransferase [Mycolicibacterium sp. P9-64]|uniref:methyltransferase n=1 Tax=Mycolicibacterium sp. P9-64 TaxID=2024612 RepID=UPI0011EED652|nr:methyltransferase [Mycolicibacterium sp. P9-64]KAA0084397.1 hydroxyneurosporene methyltransferase [Mycolicibacterium sp. P9-64]
MSNAPKIPPARVAAAVDRVRHHLSRLHLRMAPPPIAVMELIFGAWLSQAITAATQLGIADALAAGPLTADELGRKVGADPDAVARLMRLLISRGIFRRRSGNRFALNALGDTLRSDAPVSMAGAALFFGSKEHREHWTSLVESIRTGKASVPAIRGMEFFEYVAENPDFAALFNNAMTSTSEMLEAALVAAADLNRFRTIADVGGGHGRLLSAMLTAAPNARGVLVDLPDVVAGAPDVFAERGVTERVRIEGGSFFDGVPAGADAYVMKNVLHDWDDDKAADILRNIRAVSDSGTTLLLFEMVIPDHDREFFGKLVDLEMLLVGGSFERSEKQWRTVLERGGFRLTRIVPTASPVSVVEAAPA